MKLNLGCGGDVKPDYTNVDLRKTHGSVLEADLSNFPWPFENESAEEILMLDFLEHFPYRETQRILLECYRVLTPEGTVVIQVPDGEHLTRAFGQIGEYLCNRCGYQIDDRRALTGRCERCGQTLTEISEAAMMRLYGGQDYVGNFHQVCFSKSALCAKAKQAGLTLLYYEEQDHQFANWNFRARFQKDDIW